MRVRAFRRLGAAFVLAELIEWFALITLAVVVYDETGDALATTALFVSTKLVPSLLVPILAARTDGWATPRGIGALFGVEAVLFAAMAAALTDFSLWVICALALVDGVAAALVRAFTRAAIARTMEPLGLLREANGALNVGFAVMNIAGPSMAGLAVATFTPRTVLLIGAALLLASALYLGWGAASGPSSSDSTPWMRRFGDALRYVRGRPVTMAIIVGEGFVMMFGTLVAPIEVVYAKDALDAGAEGYAALAAAWGAGITIGSLVFLRVGRHSLGTALVISTAAMGIGIALMAGAGTLLVACACAVLGGAGNGVQWVSAVTALQESVSSEMQVRVAGLFEGVVTLVPGLGYLLGGVITQVTSPRLAFLIAGVGILAAASLGGLALTVRRRRQAVAGAPG